jgi:hypothetical protein
LYLISSAGCKQNSYDFFGGWKQGLRGSHEFSVDPTDSLHPNLRRFLNQEGKSETRRGEKTGGGKREFLPSWLPAFLIESQSAIEEVDAARLQVERRPPGALAPDAALPPNICACGGLFTHRLRRSRSTCV